MLTLYRPRLAELDFRRRLLGDPDTMAYNHAYGGVIDFPRARWGDWYARWVDCTGGNRFYRYLRLGDGTFVGEVAYRLDEERGLWMCGIIVLGAYRGRRFGSMGLALLCAAARANGVEALHDEIAAGNPAVQMFLRHGFQIVSRTPEAVLVRRDLRNAP